MVDPSPRMGQLFFVDGEYSDVNLRFNERHLVRIGGTAGEKAHLKVNRSGFLVTFMLWITV